MNTSTLLYFVILILSFMSTTLAGKSDFALAAGKKEVLDLLQYLSTLVELKRGYQSMATAINGATTFDGFMNAARNSTLKTEDVEALKGKAETNADTLYDKIETYRGNFWNLLNEANLNGDDIPMDTRLIKIRTECNLYRTNAEDTY